MMKELIKNLVENLINPKLKEQRKFDLKHELQVKFEKSLYLKEYLRTKAWQDYDKPKIHDELESGIRRLLNDGMNMEEVGIKSVLSYMKAILDRLSQMRHDIESGEEAGIKLENMK